MANVLIINYKVLWNLLRALVARPEDLSLVPTTQVWQITPACTYSFRKSKTSVHSCTQVHMCIHL